MVDSIRQHRILFALSKEIPLAPAGEEQEISAGPGNVLTIDELADYLKISKSTLYKLAQDGALPGQKVGKRWRFHRDAIDSWLKNQPMAAEAARKESNRDH